MTSRRWPRRSATPGRRRDGRAARAWCRSAISPWATAAARRRTPTSRTTTPSWARSPTRSPRAPWSRRRWPSSTATASRRREPTSSSTSPAPPTAARWTSWPRPCSDPPGRSAAQSGQHALSVGADRAQGVGVPDQLQAHAARAGVWDLADALGVRVGVGAHDEALLGELVVAELLVGQALHLGGVVDVVAVDLVHLRRLPLAGPRQCRVLVP